VPTWSLPSWANGTDDLSKTLREVQQRAHARAEAVADWISEQVSARQTLDYETQNGVIHSLNSVAKGAHPLSVVALACSIVALLIATFALLALTPIFRLIWTTAIAVLKHTPLYCVCSSTRVQESNNVVSAHKGSHKKIIYRASLARAGTLESTDIPVALTLHTSGKAKIEHGPQRITEFVYGNYRRELFLASVVMGSTCKCECALNDDIEISIVNSWPSLSTSPEDAYSTNALGESRC
jgi:hypothetical protein